MTRAAIFDMDGLLVDSEPLWTRAEMEIFAPLGLRLSEKDCAQTVGLGLEQVVEYRFRQHPWTGPERQEVARAIHRRVLELMRSEVRPRPGALETLRLVSDLGFRVALATASDHQLIEAALGRIGALGHFHHLQSAVELPPKPHPAVFLRAAEALGVEPENCVGFEDSLPGLRAILAAGMKAVAVPEPRLRDHPDFLQAHLRLDTLGELDRERLLGLFEPAPVSAGRRP